MSKFDEVIALAIHSLRTEEDAEEVNITFTIKDEDFNICVTRKDERQ